MFVCLRLLDELMLGFCYSNLTLETGGFELASTITLVLQANRLTKCIFCVKHKYFFKKKFFFQLSFATNEQTYAFPSKTIQNTFSNQLTAIERTLV